MRESFGKLVSRVARPGLPILALTAFWLALLPPLVQRGMMTCSHDGALYLLRVFQFDALLQPGRLWPRWSPGMVFGYGYPLFNFHPVLGLYPASLLHRLGSSLLQGWNLSLAFSMLLSGLAMYMWARRMMNARGALISAVAFMFAPYQLYDVYWRGNMAEALSLPLLPLASWAALCVAQDRRWRHVSIGALAFAAILLTHPAAGLIFSLLFSSYGLVLLSMARERRRAMLQLASMVVLGLALAAFFLMPAFLERDQAQLGRAVASSGSDFRNFFLTLGELIGPVQAPDPVLVNPAPPRSLGWALGLLALIGVGATWWRRARLGATALGASAMHTRHVLWAGLTLVGVILMMLPVSQVIWEHVPLLPFIQFPWRFLGVASMLASLLAGSGIAAFSRAESVPPVGAPAGASMGAWKSNGVLIAFLVALLIGYVPWAFPRLCSAPENHTQASYVAFEESIQMLGTTTYGEYLPVGVQELPATSPMAQPMRAGQPYVRWDAPGARIIQARDDGLSGELELESDAPIQVVYRAFYFPGWQAQLDHRPAVLKVIPPLGLMAMDVPVGVHTLTIQFGSTPVRLVGEAVSRVSLILILVIGIVDWRSSARSEGFQPVTSGVIGRRLWLGLIVLAFAWLAFRVGVLDRFDTPLRWRRLQAGQFTGVTHVLTDPVVIAERARLLGYAVHPQRVASGQVFDLDLYWTLTQSLKLRAAVRLLDAQGLEWSDKDELYPVQGGYSPPPPSVEWPIGMVADDRHTIQVLPGAPPGNYQIVVVPFHPETLEPRTITLGQRAPGDYPGVVIGQLEVVAPSRAADSLDLAVRLQAPLSDELTLIGYSQDRTQASPGQRMSLAFGWQARRQPAINYAARLELVTSSDQVIAQYPLSLGGESYPTRQWLSGQMIRSQAVVQLPGRATSGQYTWRIVLLHENGARVGSAWLATLQLDAPERTFTAPPVSNRVDVQLGDWATLAGASAPNRVAVGQAMRVELVWKARAETNQDYKVFVHLLAANGRVFTQSDAAPAGWSRPTSGWQAGEYVSDVHTLEIKRDAPPGDYELVAGMYDAASGARLITPEGQDAIGLGMIQLSAQ